MAHCVSVRLALLRRVLAALLLCAAMPAGAKDIFDATGKHPSWEQSGNILQWVIPLGGYGLSLAFGKDGGLRDRHFDADALAELFSSDSGTAEPEAEGLNWPGPRLGGSNTHDFLVAFVRMEVTTYALKYTLNTPRPNGGRQSFPSGHTAASFMGAEFIRLQFGNGWAVPAYLAASWVGFTRVQSYNHYWGDVFGGVLIGIAANHDFDHLETPVGELHFSFAAITPTTSDADDDTDPLAPMPAHASLPAPGLRVELHF